MPSAISQYLLKDAFEEDAAGTTPKAFKACGCNETTHYIEWGEGVAAGVVEIESAPRETYTGTWAPISTVTFSGTAPKTDYVRVQGNYAALRHRVSTIVVDGTVSSKITGSL